MDRKIVRDGGAAARALVKDILQTFKQLASTGMERADLHERLAQAVQDLEQAVDFVVTYYRPETRDVLAGSLPPLRLFGLVCGGWQMVRSVLAARESPAQGIDPDFHQQKVETAWFYAWHVLSQSTGLGVAATAGLATPHGPSRRSGPVAGGTGSGTELMARSRIHPLSRMFP